MSTLNVNKRASIASVDSKMKNHSNDPYVLKKLKAAKKLINKHGLPKELK